MDASQRQNRRDRIAQHAAALIETGKAARVSDAIRMAAGALGLTDGPMPTAGTVRKHAQAIAMQAMGEAEYRKSKRRLLQLAEELMTALAEALPDVEPVLMGRAAAGQLDADVTLHIRLYTNQPLPELAHALVSFGYEEPSFDSINTQHGILNRIKLVEEGVPVVLTRCPPAMCIDKQSDVFSGKAIDWLSIEQLRKQLL